MTQRAEARLAGFAYLSYIVFTMSSTMTYGRAIAGDGVAQQLSSLSHMIFQARITVLLDLLQVVSALVLAVTLYRLTKVVDPTLALLAMLFRVGEGLLGSLSILDKVQLMHLATVVTGNTTDAAGARLLGNYILNRPDELFSEFCFVIGGFIFAWLFLRGRLIPSLLAWIGVVSIGVQIVCVSLNIAGFMSVSVVNLIWLLIMTYEIPLGLWLIVKGVKTSKYDNNGLQAAGGLLKPSF